MKIKGVLYDLGDIFFEAHFWREWNYQRVVEYGLFAGSFGDFYNLYEEFLEPVYKGKKKYNDAFNDFLIYLKVQDPKCFIEQSFAKKRFFESSRILYSGVKETLNKLCNRGIKNIVITDNEQSEVQIYDSIIDKYGIRSYINKIVSSKDVGVKKPDPLIFRKALDIYQLDHKEVYFVGHDADELNGARAIGIPTIEFNNYLSVVTFADYKISNFSQILNLIDEVY